MPYGLNFYGDSLKSDEARSESEHLPDGYGVYSTFVGVSVKVGLNEGQLESAVGYSEGVIIEGGVEATKVAGKHLDISPNVGMSVQEQ